MIRFRGVLSAIVLMAGAGMAGSRAILSDAWAVGHYGAAVGEALVPGGLLVVAGLLLWPRKRR